MCSTIRDATIRTSATRREGGGSAGVDYNAWMPLADLVGKGFGDKLHHYDAGQLGVWDGAKLTLVRTAMVAVDIPADVPAALSGVMAQTKVGAVAPASNNYLFVGLQNAEGADDVTAPGLIFSERYFRDATLTGSAASPTLTPTSTTIAHGLIQGAGAGADVGCLAIPNTTTTGVRLNALYSAPGVTRPRADNTATLTGWGYEDGEPSPRRVILWMPDLGVETPDASLEFYRLRFLFTGGMWG